MDIVLGGRPAGVRIELCLKPCAARPSDGPIRSTTAALRAGGQEKVANTAEAARSAVQTARLVVKATEEDKAPGPYTARALSDVETALASVATHIGAVQPPTAGSTVLRSKVTSLLTDCRTALADLRIAAREGRYGELVRLAEPLPRLAARLKRLEEPRPT